MEPEEFSRVLGQILGSYPYTMDERDRINEAAGQADSIEEMPADIQELLSKYSSEERALKKYTKKTGPPKLKPKGGNPNHDAKTGKFTSKPGGSGGIKSATKAPKKTVTTEAVKPGVSLSSTVAKDRAAIAKNKGVSTQLKDTPEIAKSVKSAYEFKASSGMSSRVNMSTSTIEDGQITVKGNIYNDKGVKVGDFERSLNSKNGTAYNDRIKINPKYTGQRFGDEFYSHSNKQLASMGVKKVGLEANYDVGGYAWARRGIGWGPTGRKNGESNVANNIDKYLAADSKKPAGQRLSDADRKQLEIWSARMRKPLNASAPTPNDLASFGEGNYTIPRKTAGGREFTSWPGKEIMLGSTWAGEYDTGASPGRSSRSSYMDDIERLYAKEEAAFIPNDELDPHGLDSDFNMFHVDLFMEPNDPNESRASRLSTVERTIVKDSIHCKECQANNDPNKVPVHPNCQCNVITDSIESGVADPTHRLFNVLNPNTVDMITPDGVDIPAAIQLDPATTAILDPENARWADLMRWLEQMQPYLEQANLYVSIVVDDDTDEALAEVEEVIDLLASDIEAGLEALKTGKFWFSIAKAAI